MRVGIDARKLRDGGIGTYIRHLLSACLERPRNHRFVAFVDPRDLGRAAWTSRGAVERSVRAGKYSIAEHVVLPMAARRERIDLLHSPHYTLPLTWGGTAVVTIHDLIHVRFARFFPPGVELYARAVAGAATRRARIVITDSRHTRDEVIELLAADPARVRVVPLGVSRAIYRRTEDQVERFLRLRSLPTGYALYVGARKRHKNLALVLEALSLIPEPSRPPLVLSGDRWAAGDPLARLAGRLGVEGVVHFAGELDDDQELSLVYSGAALYVQPSLIEGFGLPPLEAMACGVPVLSSSAGALAETLGEAAAFLPPQGPEAWADAIAVLLRDPARRAELGRRGLAHARSFTWERAAEATLDLYEEAFGRG